jgi:hypothetical protein
MVPSLAWTAIFVTVDLDSITQEIPNADSRKQHSMACRILGLPEGNPSSDQNTPRLSFASANLLDFASRLGYEIGHNLRL